MTGAPVPDLFACVVQLHASEEARLERSQGHHVHALFLELMRRADHTLAAALHAPATTKPFTVAPLDARAQQLRPGSQYTLRMSLLRNDLFTPFAHSFFQGATREVWLGRARFVVREVLTTPGSHPLAGSTSWAALLERSRPVDELALHFMTPTAFTLGSDERGQRQIGLFPDAQAVFGSLLRRWNDLSSVALPSDLLQRITILPSRYSIQTQVLHFARNPQLGFVGHCRYTLRGSPADQRLVHTLALAASFLGVGYKTTQGMGLVQADVDG